MQGTLKLYSQFINDVLYLDRSIEYYWLRSIHWNLQRSVNHLDFRVYDWKENSDSLKSIKETIYKIKWLIKTILFFLEVGKFGWKNWMEKLKILIVLMYKNISGNKSKEYPQVLQFWWLALKNFQGISREQVFVNDSSEILVKFCRIGPQFERFFGDHSFEN